LLISQLIYLVSFRLERQSGIFPGVKPAHQRVHILVAVLFENVRHPGAGSFVRSSTVGNNRSIAWNIGEMLLDLIGWGTNGARKFCFRIGPGFMISRIDEK